MSDDLDFDMEVVEGDELDEMGAEGSSGSVECTRPEIRKDANDRDDKSTSSVDDGPNIGEQEKVNGDESSERDKEELHDTNTTAEWGALGAPPEDWKIEYLGEKFEVIKNSADPSKYSEDGEVVLYSMPAYDDGKGPVRVEAGSIGSKKFRVPPHTLLFPKLNITKKRFWLVKERHSKPSLCSTEYWPLVPNGELNLEYYHQLFGADGFINKPRLSSSATTNSHQRIKSNLFEKVRLPVPPLHEQRKIASVLYAVDQAIQKTEAIIEQAKRVKRGLVQDLLCRGIDSEGKLRSVRSANFRETRLGKFPESWKLKQLRSLTTESITYGIVQPGPDTPGGVPFIRSGDATGGRLEPDSLQRTTEEIAESYSRSRVNAGEIITTIRATVGESHQVPASLDGANLGRGVARIVPTEEIDNRFLLWTMRSGYMERQFKMYMKGSTYSEITLEQLGKLKVALPEPGEQKRISDVLDMQEKKIGNEQDRIDHLNRIKRGLMQDLLTGEVRTADKAIDVLDEVVEHG